MSTKSKLKAVDPKTATPSKAKVMVFGSPGAGKTWWALDFPNVYYIDTEGGADLPHYTDKLKKSSGSYFGPEQGSLDGEEVIAQFTALATEQHNYRTVVLDSFSKIWNSIITREAERLGEKDAFGASKKPAIQWWRRLLLWIDRIDMNVIIICHEKPTWLADKQGPPTFDGYEKIAYELNLSLHVQKRGPERTGTVKKTRLQSFPEGMELPWNYDTFAERFGRDVIEGKVAVVEIATTEQVAELQQLKDAIKPDESRLSDWLEKAKATQFAELTKSKADELLTAWRKRAESLKTTTAV